MESLIIQPVRALEGEVTLPGSKSISNRALLLASEAQGQTRLVNLLDSDDTAYMLRALEQLRISIIEEGGDRLVSGVAGPLVDDDRHEALNLGLAGTAFRPITDAWSRVRRRPSALSRTASPAW